MKMYKILFFFIGVISFGNAKSQYKNMDNNKYQVIPLNNGKFVQCETVGAEQAKQIIVNYSGQHIEKYSAETYTSYHLSDNRGIIVDSYGATVYTKFDELIAVVQDFMIQAQYQDENHILKRFQIDEHFPSFVDSLCTTLMDKYSINETKVSINTLYELEIAINNDINPTQSYMENYISVIAIVGKCFENTVQAKWNMSYVRYANVWEPRMIIAGKEFEFFSEIWEDIYQKQIRNTRILSETYAGILMRHSR